MKKHDEGYVLAYVTVVLLVFCLVATTILTGALRNLQTQQKINDQMKDQYVAAGMIEKVMSQWDGYESTFEKDQEVGDTGVICAEVNYGVVTLTATYGMVMITCQVEDGEYVSYDISTVEPVPTGSGGASE